MESKILIADDEKDYRDILVKILESKNLSVEVAGDGAEAFTRLCAERFDTLITDIRMPQMDGIETISRIRKFIKEQGKITIPVIFITGFADPDAYVKAEKFGKVIYKPFDMRIFLDEVDKALDKK